MPNKDSLKQPVVYHKFTVKELEDALKRISANDKKHREKVRKRQKVLTVGTINPFYLQFSDDWFDPKEFSDNCLVADFVDAKEVHIYADGTGNETEAEKPLSRE